MSVNRRLCVVMLGVGVLGTWSLWKPPALAQIKVVVPAGAALPVAPAPDVGQPPDGEFADGVSLPTDRKAKKSIELAEDFIKEEDWSGAAETLQGLLEAKEDLFLQVKRKDAKGKESVQWTSIKAEANRLLGTMPANGLEVYELKYGARAKERLNQAKAKGDRQVLAEVAQRYLHTESGAEATNLLGTYHLDRGQYLMAALCFERLLTHEKAGKLSPITLLKATLAFRRAANQESSSEALMTRMADKAWSQITKANPAGIQVGERKISLEDLQKELDKGKESPLLVSIFDWPCFRGNPSRSAQGNGSSPFLEYKWYQKTITSTFTQRFVDQAVSSYEGREAVMPAFFPIAAAGKLVYRSYFGLHAVDLKNGKLQWEQPSAFGLDVLGKDKDPNTSQQVIMQQWLQWYMAAGPQGGTQGFIFENSVLGSLSTDNNYVYAVDDMGVPPHPNALQQMMWGGMPNFGPFSDAVHYNKLLAINLESGKLVGELGGKDPNFKPPVVNNPGKVPPQPVKPPEKKPMETDYSLEGSYFLGPPLPVGGKLYVMNEKNSELRLICLDPPREEPQPDGKMISYPPAINWIQPVGDLRENKLLMSPGRRIQAVHLAYGDGILVCPTNLGKVLGVDLLSHSLVWAYSYREDQDRNSGVVKQPGMWMNPAQDLNLRPDWKVSAPVIQDGKVVFTAPDGASVHCLNLRTGTRAWKAPRTDDLYMAGVFSGKVLLVGKSSCRALNLPDGKQLWAKETGLPSGQGVASDNVYFLPLKSAYLSKEPEVCSIDINKGEVVAHTKSRKKEVPGNLLFYEGDVLSQTVSQVTAYPQLKVKLAQIQEALKKNPKDPLGLTERGELYLDKGDIMAAVDDLRTALDQKPSEEVLPKTRTKLYEAYTELFQRDFNTASEKFLDEYKDMCKVTIPKEATPDEVKNFKKEEQARQANFLCLMGKGREKQGKLVDAFEYYRQFGTLNGNQDLVSVIDEPTVKARPDIWAQGRIAAMITTATEEQRKPLENKIAQEWASVQKANNLDQLRSFVASFGSLFTVGKEARLQLADRLLTDGFSEQAFLEAELHLQQVRRQGDVQQAARALEAQARLLIKKGLLEDAAFCYRVLGRDFGKTVIRDGKTGADFFNELATDKRFLPFLDEPRAAWSGGKIKAKENTGGPFQMTQQTINFEPDGEVMPFFQRHRIGLNMGTFQLKMVDRYTNEERWSHNLASPNNNVNWGYNPNGYARFVYNLQGHLAVLNYGRMVYGLDLVDRKVLWEKDLIPNMPSQQLMHDGNGGLQVYYPDGYWRKVGQAGPVEASYVCLHSHLGLVAMDPLKGTVLWSKSDVPVGTQIFGDDQHLYMIEVRTNGTTGASRALRAHDGVAVEVPDFSEIYQRKVRTMGRNLLLSENDAQGAMVLRLYDVHTGKDKWKKTFSQRAMLLKAQDSTIAGVVEPTNGGKVTVLDLDTQKELFQAKVEPKDVDGSSEVHLLQDQDQVYLAINKPNNNPQAGMVFWANHIMGMRRLNVSGKVYAFDRTNGSLRWHNDVPSQMLVVEQFQDMPILLFTNQFNRVLNPQNGQAVQCTSVLSIDKRTGKRLWDKEYRSNGSQNYYFYWLNNNPRAGVVELISYNLKLIHYLEGNEPTAKVEAPGAGGNPGVGEAPVRVIRGGVIRRVVVPVQVPAIPQAK